MDNCPLPPVPWRLIFSIFFDRGVLEFFRLTHFTPTTHQFGNFCFPFWKTCGIGIDCVFCCGIPCKEFEDCLNLMRVLDNTRAL
nr:MAG TPA: hypothetical protein [Caudoviricetes sp.]